MTYQLTKELETGNYIIDKEHTELFDAVNQLLDACAHGKGRTTVNSTLKFLLDYVDKHFAHENQLQKDNNYPNQANHYLFHEEYKRKLRDIAAQIASHEPTITDLSQLNSHIAVLISHIKTEDKKLGAFLHTK